ncbi:alpha/beta fold hydrolase [Curtobacterium pusillum]|uniref:Alpha/beta fold hydrolase n=1 Tax=Curtobacterium pusillum TaxID=69373 RepID=A0ABX2MGF6_9MICO|nr:alpha/beta fold hydrolase [Curtobacterium pusillum]NUU14741.1 alpha/beta fold hydrolase [Curtobacterium pusillum]GLK31712.1 dihydrolipoamide acetyltransferase [Curtobacterium pusillum]
MRARTETVEIDGNAVRLHTLAPAGRLRDALGPTVVLVHGIGMSHRSFRRSQRALAAGHRTVSVDLPGFGGLRGPGRRLSMEELGDLVVRAVASRGAGELVLVGQSMGAQVVAEAARLHADIVGSVVLVGPVVTAGRRSALLQGADLARDCLVEGLRMNGVVGTDYLRSVPQYLRELRPMLRHRIEDTVPRLGQPVLVVRGSEDPIARHDWGERLATLARRGAFVELPGPHHVQEHQPVALARLVDEFRRVQTLEASG